MNESNRRIDVQRTKLSMDTISDKTQSMIQNIMALKQEINRLKEEDKLKDNIIKELLESCSTMRSTIEQQKRNIMELENRETISSAINDDSMNSDRSTNDLSVIASSNAYQVELAKGFFVDKNRLERVRCNVDLNPSRIVCNLVTLFFTRDEILNQSTTGKPKLKLGKDSNKELNSEEESETLSPWKINMIRDELRNILLKRGNYSANEIQTEALRVERYIKKKVTSVKQWYIKAKKNLTPAEIDKSGDAVLSVSILNHCKMEINDDPEINRVEIKDG